MKTFLAMLLSLSALALPSRVAAQTPLDAPTINGAVVSSGNTSLVIETDGGTKKSFLIDTTTTLPAGGVTVGSRVAVQYQPLDVERAQALSISLLEPTPPAGASTAASTEPAREQSRGPVDMSGPVPLLGLASLAIVVGGLFAWVFARRGHQETPHISL
jgi:hypothetical protein